MSDQYDLIPSDNLNVAFEQMTPEAQDRWLQIQIEKKREREMEALKKGYESIKRDMEMMQAEQQSRNESMAEGLRQVADASARRMKNAEDYLVKTMLGKIFAPEVSAQRMTKLLHVTGIVGKHGDPYAPYRLGNAPLAKPKPFAEYPVWLFHTKKTLAKIDAWLTENDWYDDFHTTTTKNERDSLIDELYEEYTD